MINENDCTCWPPTPECGWCGTWRPEPQSNLELMRMELLELQSSLMEV